MRMTLSLSVSIGKGHKVESRIFKRRYCASNWNSAKNRQGSGRPSLFWALFFWGSLFAHYKCNQKAKQVSNKLYLELHRSGEIHQPRVGCKLVTGCLRTCKWMALTSQDGQADSWLWFGTITKGWWTCSAHNVKGTEGGIHLEEYLNHCECQFVTGNRKWHRDLVCVKPIMSKMWLIVYPDYFQRTQDNRKAFLVFFLLFWSIFLMHVSRHQLYGLGYLDLMQEAI